MTADVYPYTAGSTGLTSIIPDRYHEGGAAALYDRLGAPEVRAAIRAELSASGRWSRVSEAENVLILRVAAEENRKWQGRTLAEVAAARGADPVETAMDLIASDRSRIQAAFFSMSEENLRAALRRPWVGISSDSASMAPEGWFLRAPVHPRAYGSFARVLGHYVRDEKVLPLADAIRRMSGLPAATLGLSGRGVLREGCLRRYRRVRPGDGGGPGDVRRPAPALGRGERGPGQREGHDQRRRVHRGTSPAAPSPGRGRAGDRGRGWQ